MAKKMNIFSKFLTLYSNKMSKTDKKHMKIFLFLLILWVVAIITMIFSLILNNKTLEIVYSILICFAWIILYFIERSVREVISKVMFVFILIVLVLSSVIFIPGFIKFANSISRQNDEVWISFLGQIIASLSAILGALWVARSQRKNEERERVKSSKVILLNDLKYISSRVKEYNINLLVNQENEHYYRVRYLNISSNWRELVAVLNKNYILTVHDVSNIYDYFTDINYITDKYEELSAIIIQNDMGLNDKKLTIKNAINKKYVEMENKFKESIETILGKLKD